MCSVVCCCMYCVIYNLYEPNFETPTRSAFFCNRSVLLINIDELDLYLKDYLFLDTRMELHTTESELDLECQQGLMKMEDNPFKDSMSLYGLPLMPTTCEQNPGPSYCPTSKQCGEMIKHLKELVWNLRLRIHNDRIIAKNAGGGGKAVENKQLKVWSL